MPEMLEPDQSLHPGLQDLPGREVREKGMLQKRDEATASQLLPWVRCPDSQQAGDRPMRRITGTRTRKSKVDILDCPQKRSDNLGETAGVAR